MANLLNAGDIVGGRYKVKSFIAEGGMQEVYKTIDLSFSRTVVLKVPKNQSAKKRFNRSAEMSARITHPHIAQTLDFLPIDKLEYLVEEYIEGRNLQLRLDNEYSSLDPHLAAHIVHHVTKGIVASHRAGVVHRDLKPSNIMVSSDAGFTQVKITDFGIAKMAQVEIEDAIEEGSDSISASSTVVGALPYMAPEIIQNARNVGPACDVWAIGAILFHLLTGHPPFGKGLGAIPRIVARELPRKEDVLKPKAQFASLVGDLWGVIEECLHPDPASRLDAKSLAKKFAQISYSTAPRRLGSIKFYGQGNGDWGFIASHGEQDVFFNAASFYGAKPENGQEVNFACFHGEPRPRAHPVLPVLRRE